MNRVPPLSAPKSGSSTPPPASTQSTLTNDTGRYVFVNVSPGNHTITVSKRFHGLQDQFPEDRRGHHDNDQRGPQGRLHHDHGRGLRFGGRGPADHQRHRRLHAYFRGAATASQPGPRRVHPGRPAARHAPGGQTAGAFSDQNVFMLDGGNNSDDMSGNATSYTTNFTGTGGTQTGGSPSGILPTPVESIEEFKVVHLQPDRGFLRLDRRPDSDGHQARHQQLSRLGLRLLLRHQRGRRQ